MIDGKTRKYCLIGENVEYSLSPHIMNMLFRKYNVNAVYFVCNVKNKFIKDAVRGAAALGINGLNVTIPYKERVIQYLDKMSRDANAIGAVNTIINRGGRLIGYDTDWIGIQKTLSDHELNEFPKCIIFGAGGAAKAALYAIKKICRQTVIINRTYERAVKLVSKFKKIFNDIEIVAKPLDFKVIHEELKAGSLIINATPVGMRGDSLIPRESIPANSVIFDLVYSPLETLLLKYAREKNIVTIDGLWMLIHQALATFKIWMDIEVEAYEVRKELEKWFLK